MVARGPDGAAACGDLVDLLLSRLAAGHDPRHLEPLGRLVQCEDLVPAHELLHGAHAARGPHARVAPQALVLCGHAGQVLALRLGDAQLLVGVLDGVGQIVPVVDLPARGLDVIEDVVEVEVRHLRGEPGCHRLALEVLEGAQAEVAHPRRLRLHLGHLADDGFVQALLGLEDVVLLVAPAELVAPKIEIRCRHGTPDVARDSPGRRNFPYGDSNKCRGLPKRSGTATSVSPGVAGSTDGQPTGRTPAPPRRHRPRRQPRGSMVLAAGARGPRRAGLPGSGERPYRVRARTAGRAAPGAVRGDEGPHQGDRHVSAGPAGALVVLHPDRGRAELRHPLPAARPGRG